MTKGQNSDSTNTAQGHQNPQHYLSSLYDQNGGNQKNVTCKKYNRRQKVKSQTVRILLKVMEIPCIIHHHSMTNNIIDIKHIQQHAVQCTLSVTISKKHSTQFLQPVVSVSG